MSQTNVRRSSGRRVQQKKTNSNRNLIIAAVVGVVVIMVAAGLALSRSGGGNIAGQQQFPNLVPPPTSPHIAEVTSPHGPYNSNPPTSGWHYGGGTAPWGVQTQPVADELSVHNLEHGGVDHPLSPRARPGDGRPAYHADTRATAAKPLHRAAAAPGR